MNTEKQRAFLSGLRDLMVRHSVETIYSTYEGDICVQPEYGNACYYDLGTIDEIEKEIKNLK